MEKSRGGKREGRGRKNGGREEVRCRRGGTWQKKSEGLGEGKREVGVGGSGEEKEKGI